MEIIVLKKFQDYIGNKISLKEYEKYCWDYADMLEKKDGKIYQ